MSEPMKFDERTLPEQIKCLFDVSSDKNMLLQDCLKAVEVKKNKIMAFRGCSDPSTYCLLYGDGICDVLEVVEKELEEKTQK